MATGRLIESLSAEIYSASKNFSEFRRNCIAGLFLCAYGVLD
jgi:hypothetical protein